MFEITICDYLCIKLNYSIKLKCVHTRREITSAAHALRTSVRYTDPLMFIASHFVATC